MRLLRDPVVIGGLLLAGIALVVGLVLTARGSASAPADVPADEVVALSDVDDLRSLDGRRVAADAALVQGVPADEGFWVSAGERRVWVQLTTAGESPFRVEAGDRVTFTGQVAAHDPDFAERPEFSAADAAELVDAGAHVEVDVGDVRLATG